MSRAAGTHGLGPFWDNFGPHTISIGDLILDFVTSRKPTEGSTVQCSPSGGQFQSERQSSMFLKSGTATGRPAPGTATGSRNRNRYHRYRSTEPVPTGRYRDRDRYHPGPVPVDRYR